jgi:uncharacterized protein (TIGR00297 family)
MGRLELGVAAAALFAFFAQRARLLSTSGAVAASFIGAVAVAVGWSWGALLILYFGFAAILSRIGRSRKAIRTEGIVAKEGPRDAAQVLANGGPFVAAAIGMLIRPHPGWAALAVGSLAASEADTSATEIGVLAGGEPRSLLTLQPVAPGTSGGITLAGTMASVVSAAFVAVVAGLLAVVALDADMIWRTTLAGVAGAFIDSVLGASLQTKRWCDGCNLPTERRIHRCGSDTRVVGGISWLDNDAVNFLSGAAGGLLAVLLSR